MGSFFMEKYGTATKVAPSHHVGLRVGCLYRCVLGHIKGGQAWKR